MIIAGFVQLLKGENVESLPSYAAKIQAITALVPAANVFSQNLPRGYQLPAILVHKYGGAQDYEYAGPQNTREDQIQFDVYATTGDTVEQIAEAVRALLLDFKYSTIPDGTAVSACFLERDIDLPFAVSMDQKGNTNRRTLGFRVVSQQ